MKFRFRCSECSFQGISSESIKEQFVEVNNGIYYEIECDLGHKTNVIIQEEKFEILFEIGAMAIIDGYPREAISSFTSSLERFYEFFMIFAAVSYGVTVKEFEMTWKKLKTSERQVGGFYICFLHYFKKSPQAFSEKLTKLRNDVIHNGYIPTEEEAINYGNEVLQLIQNILFEMNFTQNIEPLLEITRHKRSSINFDDKTRRTGIVALPTILRIKGQGAYDGKHLKEIMLERGDFRVIH